MDAAERVPSARIFRDVFLQTSHGIVILSEAPHRLIV
jgi:hypothetical protein